MYGDETTGSMRAAMRETARRRQMQLEYNEKNGIVPSDIRKNINGAMGLVCDADYVDFSEDEAVPV